MSAAVPDATPFLHAGACHGLAGHPPTVLFGKNRMVRPQPRC
ncbi:MAG: hypothetical protein AVDCRST_MAG73-3036 [uncultured Thermomicrobiales bacterium]|uniref:Uncharacterized protein n=1 Tax=uncultured Thermomicrobiales bacterium TaxID=1645740 RepID=A0A6J4UN71_9BACT|nr:MAG: hypothetical protein AVDCRST_MAG73-3036 [uncultured Thermomicrobiales bacterium]